MSENEINTNSTCPFTGEANSWVEKELDCGKWEGTSLADNSTITSESLEGLRLRYGKVTLMRLQRESE